MLGVSRGFDGQLAARTGLSSRALRLARVKPTLIYTFLRIGLFAVLLAALLAIGITPWIATVGSALLALLISYIFFARLRHQVTARVASRRAAPAFDEDADAEDTAIERDPAAASQFARRRRPPADEDIE